jgi:hypothetical protein
VPNRYGEDPDDNTPTPPPPPTPTTHQRNTKHQTRLAAIQACTLCDNDGYHHTQVCDHTDHTQAAHRGMALIRHTMGWKQPENPPQAQPGAKNKQP